VFSVDLFWTVMMRWLLEWYFFFFQEKERSQVLTRLFLKNQANDWRGNFPELATLCTDFLHSNIV
jgi:hypothetical protein